MNEIDKMKTEHARYKKALKDIAHGVYQVEPSVMAHRALNPPPPTPVTVENILAALVKLNEAKSKQGRPVLHSIRVFSDQSGYIYDESDGFSQSFFSLRQALDMLESGGV